MYRPIEPQDGEAALAAHPHRFTLRGDPATLAMPPLCPNCGAAAAERFEVQKVFRRTSSDDPTRHVISSLRLPLCVACAARHRGIAVAPTALQRVLAGFSSFDMLGAVALSAAGLFVLNLVLRELLKGRVINGLLLGALAAVFFLIAWLHGRHVWDATAHRRVPPQGEVARAFDFSDDVSPMFEQPRFVCTVKDAAFATAFAHLNADRLYRPESAAARQEQATAKWKFWLAVAVMVLIGILGAIFGD